jgi:AcrR family transcriptional regulator
MPKPAIIPREKIIDTAYKLTKEQGIEATTVTAVAERLGCSIRPVFYHLGCMENLRKEICNLAMQEYSKVLHSQIAGVTSVKAIGLNYIRFARENPHLFKLLFLNDTQRDVSIIYSSLDANKPFVVRLLKESYGITDDKHAEDVYIKLGIFCNGIATMIISNIAIFTDEEVNRLITEVAHKLIN